VEPDSGGDRRMTLSDPQGFEDVEVNGG